MGWKGLHKKLVIKVLEEVHRNGLAGNIMIFQGNITECYYGVYYVLQKLQNCECSYKGIFIHSWSCFMTCKISYLIEKCSTSSNFTNQTNLLVSDP